MLTNTCFSSQVSTYGAVGRTNELGALPGTGCRWGLIFASCKSSRTFGFKYARPLYFFGHNAVLLGFYYFLAGNSTIF
jgi:hypothetical protein